MRKGMSFNELVTIILAALILALIAIVIISAINPLGSSAHSFGEEAVEVISGD